MEQEGEKMKVIHEGDGTKRIDCSFCGSRLEYDMRDVHYRYSIGEAYIVCPVCGEKTVVRLALQDVKDRFIFECRGETTLNED